MACSSALFLENTIVMSTIIVASIPPTEIAKPLYNASSGAIGKLMGRTECHNEECR